LQVLAHDETPDWERQQRETTHLLMTSAAESGSDPDAVRAQLAEARRRRSMRCCAASSSSHNAPKTLRT
jgi:hypothetical protein